MGTNVSRTLTGRFRALYFRQGSQFGPILESPNGKPKLLGEQLLKKAAKEISFRSSRTEGAESVS